MRSLVSAHGPFVSVHLPPGAAPGVWQIMRGSFGLSDVVLTVLDRALASGAGPDGRSLIVAGSRLLVDSPPAWWPPTVVTRVSDLPYMLPLAPRLGVRALVGGPDPGRRAFDRFLASPIEGLARCASLLSAGRVEALVVDADGLRGQMVWVSGTHRDQVAADSATPRAAGLSPNRQWADEALPMAAMAAGASVLVADGVPLADGVGVLLRPDLDPSVDE
jgi:hypothetical protein